MFSFCSFFLSILNVLDLTYNKLLISAPLIRFVMFAGSSPKDRVNTDFSAVWSVICETESLGSSAFVAKTKSQDFSDSAVSVLTLLLNVFSPKSPNVME